MTRLYPGFNYRLTTRYGQFEAVVASADDRVVRLDGGRSFLTAALQEMTPLYQDDFKNFSDEKRSKLAKEGKALPDGSYPIENGGDLHRAIQAYGRASDKEAAKSHIKKQAKDLGMEDALPDDWQDAKTASAAAPQVEVPVADRIRYAMAQVKVNRV